MAIDIKPEHVAIAGGAAILGYVLLSRQGGTSIAVTGPSERTSLAVIEAGLGYAELGARERISFEEIRASERVAISELTTREKIARTFAGSLDFRTGAEKEVALAGIRAEEQKGAFDFFGSIFQTALRFFGL